MYVTVATPGDTPITTPVLDPTEAIVSGLLLHKPVPGGQVSVVPAPTHTLIVPVIGPGLGLTVTETLAEQPPGNMVYTMVATPGDMPVTIPDTEPIVATGILRLLHDPPAGVAFNVSVLPTHNARLIPVDKPDMDGLGFTVTSAVAKQPKELV